MNTHGGTFPFAFDSLVFVCYLEGMQNSGSVGAVGVINDVDLTQQEALAFVNPQLTQEVTHNISYDNIQVTGAIIGPSGAGKSSLINSMCGLKGNQRAKEGAMETTAIKSVPYEAAKGGYKLVDLPGVGTKTVPPETYAKQFELHTYDFLVVLLINPRLENAAQLNQWAINLAEHDLKKPIFLVYSNFDSFVKAFYAEKTQYDEDAPFLADLDKALQELYASNAKSLLRDKFPKGVFFVGRALRPKRQNDFDHVFDFESLMLSIANSLNARKRDVVVQNFNGYSTLWVEAKKQSLKDMMIGMAIGSAVSGAIPVPGPGAAIDIGLVLGFAYKCKKVFCLEENDIKQHFSKEIAVLFIPRVAAILATIGVSIAITSIDDAIKVVPIIGTIVGSVVGVAISGPIMYATLFKVRDLFAELVFDMLQAEAKLQASAHYGVTK